MFLRPVVARLQLFYVPVQAVLVPGGHGVSMLVKLAVSCTSAGVRPRGAVYCFNITEHVVYC
jgi:hypothetical protein